MVLAWVVSAGLSLFISTYTKVADGLQIVAYCRVNEVVPGTPSGFVVVARRRVEEVTATAVEVVAAPSAGERAKLPAEATCAFSKRNTNAIEASMVIIAAPMNVFCIVIK